MPVEQSGNVTPGHSVIWTTDDVIEDGGPALGTSERVLAQLLGADFNTTNDQQIALPSSIPAFQLTRIIVTNASADLSTSTVPLGGFYPTVSKGGTPIVAASQSYSTLTAATKILNPTIASFGTTTKFSSANLTSFSIYFALSTAHGSAATADIYLVGIVLAQ